MSKTFIPILRYPKVLKRSKTRAQKARRILGIDPGLASTGWGVVDSADGKIKYIDHGTIKTKAGEPRAERLFFILQFIRSIIEKYKPSLAAMETLYFGKNVTSAIPVAEARGVISAAIAEKGMPLFELTPNAIKQGVVGSARADKEQVQEMVRIILGLKENPKPDHAADALGAAICAANHAALNAAANCEAVKIPRGSKG
jgi:crossover junction endodeoxyribonuclease RuvC